MARLTLNSAQCTGVPRIDDEHRALVQMLNHLHDLIVKRAEPVDILDRLAELNALASAHFALEEKIMAELEWPRLRERCDLHARLLGQVRDIIDAYETGFYLSREGLPGSLGKWLSEAIDADVKMFAELGDPTLRA
jgi:hemerythrin